MIIHIQGCNIHSEEDFHFFWLRAFDLPFYGKNLDALRDTLLGGLERPIHLIWHDFPSSRAALGIVSDEILKIFKEAVQQDQLHREQERFSFELR